MITLQGDCETSRSFKGWVKFPRQRPPVVWPQQGQEERPDIARAPGLPVAGSQEDRCGPRSWGCAFRAWMLPALPVLPPPPAPSNPLIANIWRPGGSLRCCLRCSRSGKPGSGALALCSVAAAVSASPSTSFPKAPACPPGGSSLLPRRGLSGRPRGCPSARREQPAAPSPAALNLALPPPPALEAAARN